MPRLFLTAKEQALFSDWTKEFMKDIVGQFIVYYPVSMIKTYVDNVYEEAIERIFERPIKIDVRAGQVTRENALNKFGSYQKSASLQVHAHKKDLDDKGIIVSIGDYFVYGDEIFELIDVKEMNNVYGQEEYKNDLELQGRSVGVGHFELITLKQELIRGKTFKDSQPQIFEQQRGLEENHEGKTADFREVRNALKEEMPEIALGEGPRVVGPTEDGLRSTVYDE